MNNDILIDQARMLYAKLLARKITLELINTERLDRLVDWAYNRYQRRLNRCVICYTHRKCDCIREMGEDHTVCGQLHFGDLIYR